MTVSKVCAIQAIPTTVLTSVYCDEMISVSKLVHGEPGGATGSRDRWRRVGAVSGILLGGICGGWIVKSEGGFVRAMWVAAGLKFGLIGWALSLGPEEKK